MSVCFPERLLLFRQGVLRFREGGSHHVEGLQEYGKEQFNKAVIMLLSNLPGQWQYS